MNYFLDTEFSERPGQIELISIGLVCEDGRELYLESADFDESKCNQWVVDNVLPLLGPPDQRKNNDDISKAIIKFTEEDPAPDFWAYYADYDWVVFCGLFGLMVDLPEGFPMLCMDLQQWWIQLGRDPQMKPADPVDEHNALADAKWNREFHGRITGFTQMQAALVRRQFESRERTLRAVALIAEQRRKYETRDEACVRMGDIVNREMYNRRGPGTAQLCTGRFITGCPDCETLRRCCEFHSLSGGIR